MTDTVEDETASKIPQIVGNASAPFIFFDIASAQGVEAGVVIIELVARTIVATGGKDIRTEIVATAHLRTSVKGAQSLRNAIDDVMLMLAPAEQPDGKPN